MTQASAKEELMTRLGSLLFCATLVLGAALLSCGSGSGGGSGGSGGVLGGSGGGGVQGGSGGTGVGGTEAVLAIVPGDGTITGWVRNPSEPKVANKAAAIATTVTEAVDLIDGGADPWYAPPYTPNVFAWQNYMNTTVNPPDGYTVKMYILQMPTAAQATALYASLVDGTHSLYTSTPEPFAEMSPAVGDASRIVNSGIDWWINFRKGAYYCEIFLGYAEKTDMAGKQQAIDFVTAIAAKM
jgi:hypothetical protein